MSIHCRDYPDNLENLREPRLRAPTTALVKALLMVAGSMVQFASDASARSRGLLAAFRATKISYGKPFDSLTWTLICCFSMHHAILQASFSTVTSCAFNLDLH